jgi:hypothetical protein
MARLLTVVLATFVGAAGTHPMKTVAVAAPPLPGQESAAVYSGAALLRSCGRETEFLGGVCFGMVAGLVWASQRFDICAIEGITTNQAIAIIVRFLNDHPEMQQENAEALIVQALQFEFPCKRSN